jgi:hypothetical protein
MERTSRYQPLCETVTVAVIDHDTLTGADRGPLSEGIT